MARIIFVTPPLPTRAFSGGLWCILRYAAGLKAGGHTVAVLPIAQCRSPDWWDRGVPVLEVPGPDPRPGLGILVRAAAAGQARGAARALAAAARGCFDRLTERAASYAVRRGLALERAARVAETCDIAVATSFETALPALRLRAGRRFYLVQHFEPLFAPDYPDPWLAEIEARATYHLGLRTIANSSWLKSRLEAEVSGIEVAVCPPGVDHEALFGEARRREVGSAVNIISYGGRGASWKGFAEMAEAVRIVRARSDVPVRWRVFGTCCMPPNNPVASYEPLGFLQGAALRRAYQCADLLLSASWYESFPLFPIEAMACGLPVVTTQPGTEEYATHGVTAEIVPPRDPDGIAAGVSRLIMDPFYAFEIARRGQAASLAFTWEAAVNRLQRLLVPGRTPAPQGAGVRPAAVAGDCGPESGSAR